jgi:hypothetical protein
MDRRPQQMEKTEHPKFFDWLWIYEDMNEPMSAMEV